MKESEHNLEAFAQDCGWSGPPLLWHEERGFLPPCELDASFFHLYGLNCDDAAYILDTFPILRRKGEEKHGHYRTKYTAPAETESPGQSYQTRLNPLPTDPRLSQPLKAGALEGTPHEPFH